MFFCFPLSFLELDCKLKKKGQQSEAVEETNKLLETSGSKNVR